MGPTHPPIPIPTHPPHFCPLSNSLVQKNNGQAGPPCVHKLARIVFNAQAAQCSTIGKRKAGFGMEEQIRIPVCVNAP